MAILAARCAAIDALAGAGARFVLCRGGDEAAWKNGRAKKPVSGSAAWQRPESAPAIAEVKRHAIEGRPLAVVTPSLGIAVLDKDDGHPDALAEAEAILGIPPAFVVPSRQPGRFHAIYRGAPVHPPGHQAAGQPCDGAWRTESGGGEIKAAGYVILHRLEAWGAHIACLEEAGMVTATHWERLAKETARRKGGNGAGPRPHDAASLIAALEAAAGAGEAKHPVLTAGAMTLANRGALAGACDTILGAYTRLGGDEAEGRRILDSAMAKAKTAPAGETAPARPPAAADALIEIARAGAALFHTPDGEAMAAIEADGHRETWPVRSAGFRRWLAWRAHKAGIRARREAMDDARAGIDAIAQFDGETHEVHRRCAMGADGRLYIDLCDDAWRAIAIDRGGWEVVARAPVHFVRSANARPLPAPERGGSLADWRPFVRGDDDAFVLLCGFAAYALAARNAALPALAIAGEQGSAKSTLSRMVAALIDPARVGIRGAPRNEDDLLIAARNSALVAYDNLDSLPGWLSDALARLCTGSGLGKRELYSDSEEVVIEARRPVLLNGIGVVVVKSDLADRAIFHHAPPIPEHGKAKRSRRAGRLRGRPPPASWPVYATPRRMAWRGSER